MWNHDDSQSVAKCRLMAWFSLNKAPHHTPGFVVTKPLESFLPALLEAFRLAGLAHDAEQPVESQNENGISWKNVHSVMCMYMYLLMLFHDVAANQFYQTQLHTHSDSVWFRLAFVCMRLQRLLFDLYRHDTRSNTLTHRLSVSFGTYIQRHNFARFLLGKRDWLWILFSLPPVSCEH